MKYRVEWNALQSAPDSAGAHCVRDTDTGRIIKAWNQVPDCMCWTQYAAEAEAYRLQLQFERMEHRLETERLIAANSARLQGYAALVDVFRLPA